MGGQRKVKVGDRESCVISVLLVLVVDQAYQSRGHELHWWWKKADRCKQAPRTLLRN